MADALLEFRGVNTYYGDLHVLKNVDYSIGRGEIVCLLGGNASGKSTTGRRSRSLPPASA